MTLSQAKKTKEDELKQAKAALRAAKDTHEAFFGKSESTEACPACSHNYTVRNGSHRVRGVSVPVGQFMCQCFKYAKNCKQCPVCSLTMDPNASFSLETTNACQCIMSVTPRRSGNARAQARRDGRTRRRIVRESVQTI